uniref:WSC domain-containing protein n=1 Tax=Chromera velia CCMP2878 TaxID=1169474 RepID=A0A0G4G5D5_9ALVE|mmetsp:Transcript_16204/g.32814  ORF Transcript_16204/g.32814 Transcript_16204/m.32814 type:complete len:478 (+) Transcript_16204:343-1776(+)|eukprot:Cvel_4169.t1-p1 / transcript=Cvel_4169.t1 / gene=Cvel_4169 / organism=Chromera_velia_CCMP2878 / gene_product=hypothetical protein / transcript_product=hypothetical protein / location=Cvel_scaffold179:80213-85162(-) / protein_length=477 / sequence_SO=supercontig / SO=protein_coding / is_pseudo=false
MARRAKLLGSFLKGFLWLASLKQGTVLGLRSFLSQSLEDTGKLDSPSFFEGGPGRSVSASVPSTSRRAHCRPNALLALISERSVDFEYKGCFKLRPSATGAGAQEVEISSVTVEKCFGHCAVAPGKPHYFGLSSGSKCTCFDMITGSEDESGASCSEGCAGDSGQICGQYKPVGTGGEVPEVHYSVYSISDCNGEREETEIHDASTGPGTTTTVAPEQTTTTSAVPYFTPTTTAPPTTTATTTTAAPPHIPTLAPLEPTTTAPPLVNTTTAAAVPTSTASVVSALCVAFDGGAGELGAVGWSNTYADQVGMEVSQEECAKEAGRQKALFSLTTKGSECWIGSNGDAFESVTSDQCDAPCVGEPGVICGGSGAGTLLPAVPPTPDPNCFDLPFGGPPFVSHRLSVGEKESLTHQIAKGICKSQEELPNTPFFGVSGFYVFCFETLPESPTFGCEAECGGAPSEACGSGSKFVITALPV